MIKRHVRNGVTWVDMEAPSREELHAVMEEFGINERVEEEIIAPTPYPIVLTAPEYVYLVLHFPTRDPHGGARNQEIDFVVGKNFLITGRYEVIESIHSLHRVFEAEEMLDLPAKTRHADGLTERVIRHLYSAIRDQAEEASRMLDRIEQEIFAGKEKEMVHAISLVGRILLRFDTALSRHEQPLKMFLEHLATPELFGKAFEHHSAHIQAEHAHTTALVQSYRAVVAELRTTNESLLSSAQNEVMKTLTIMTFITYPLVVLAGIFGMNTIHDPLIGHAYDFWIIVGIMLTFVLAFFAFFRFKKWL